MVMTLNPFKRRRYSLKDVPASVRLMARLQINSYTEEEEFIPFTFAALWYEGVQQLAPEATRAVTYSCKTSTNDKDDKTVFSGSHVTRRTGEPLGRAVYEVLRDLVNGGNNPDGLVLNPDDLHKLDTRFKTPCDGFTLAILGSTDTFYTGGRMCSLIVKDTGRVVYACPVDVVTEIDSAPLCEEAFNEGRATQ